MKSIKQLKKKDLAGKKFLVRVDFNVPLKAGKVVDAFRIEQAKPTIEFLRKNGAKVILVSHIGDDGSKSLSPVVKYLSQTMPVKLVKDLDDQKVLSKMQDGEVVMIENIRRFEGEKKNDSAFAKQLAGLADLYVNEAFSVSHRAHASVVGVSKFLPAYAGLKFEEEVKNLSRVLEPKKPLIVILGGAKFSTKIPLIKKFLKSADKIFLGGALINSFFKAQGLEVGCSVVEEDVSYIKPFLKFVKTGQIILPSDVLVKEGKKTVIKKAGDLSKEDVIVDLGPEALEGIALSAKKAKTILWNGPVGWFEVGYKKGTEETAKIIAGSKAFSVVGGGDTLSAIKKLGLEKDFGFISTAGGAMLDFIGTDGKLPGITGLK